MCARSFFFFLHDVFRLPVSVSESALLRKRKRPRRRIKTGSRAASPQGSLSNFSFDVTRRFQVRVSEMHAEDLPNRIRNDDAGVRLHHLINCSSFDWGSREKVCFITFFCRNYSSQLITLIAAHSLPLSLCYCIVVVVHCALEVGGWTWISKQSHVGSCRWIQCLLTCKPI